jgi:multiple sugar transport system substrate-binding protein
MSVSNRSTSISRRSFLTRAARAAAGGVAAGMFPSVLRAAPAAFASTARDTAQIRFIGWEYHPEIVSSYVSQFEKLYHEQVHYELVPGDYASVAETKFAGGEQIDMCYAEEDYINRWYKAGWIRDLEGLPGVAQIKKAMFPINVHNLSNYQGKLTGLPYYTGYQAFLYNDLHLKKAGIKAPPHDWNEVLEQARFIKKKGIAAHPIVQMWAKDWPSFSWQLFADCYAEGEPVFDQHNNPAFADGGVAYSRVLERWKMMFHEGLVPPAIMTLQGEGVPAFQTGQYSFYTTHDYSQKVCNDPKLSRIGGHVRNIIYPGKTHRTFLWTAGYFMGAHPTNLAATWDLLRFFGYKDKEGQFVVAKTWALLYGLGTPYAEVLDDPQVKKSFESWKDVNVARTQISRYSQTRDVDKTLWFPEWDVYNTGLGQDYINGRVSLRDLLKRSSAKAIALNKQNPL